LIELYSRVREKLKMKNITHEGHLASAQKVHKGPALLILFLLRAPFRLAFGLSFRLIKLASVPKAEVLEQPHPAKQ
jgi:hypothetical protein